MREVSSRGAGFVHPVLVVRLAQAVGGCESAASKTASTSDW